MMAPRCCRQSPQTWQPGVSQAARFVAPQVEGDKRKAAAAVAAQQQQAAGGGWFGWLRGAPAAKPDQPEESASEGELSEEEKDHLRQLVTEQEEALDVGAQAF